MCDGSSVIRHLVHVAERLDIDHEGPVDEDRDTAHPSQALPELPMREMMGRATQLNPGGFIVGADHLL